MKGVLDVYLGRRLAGRLTQDEHGLTTFGYDAGWLAAPDAVPLSHSMPLRSGVFGRNECGAFFAGVLPESGKRSLVARNLGVSANNDYALLERIGGDCAGAITFTESGRSLPPEKGEYRLVRDAELEKLLLGLPGRPLMAGEAGVRLSLAGVQDKLAVRIIEGKVYLPLDGSPSSHILKPAIKEYPGVVQNEAFCMRLAQTVGLNVAHVEVGRVGVVDYLCVERYDRSVGPCIALQQVSGRRRPVLEGLLRLVEGGLIFPGAGPAGHVGRGHLQLPDRQRRRPWEELLPALWPGCHGWAHGQLSTSV
jgi:serine/threonine-protein kinase HipA